MADLRTLLGDTIGGSSVPTKFFYVYNNNRGINNGGCCCNWTVPAGIVNVTFELWGAGAAGAGGCCCQFSSQNAGGGSYSIRSHSVVAGCTFTICAAGNGACCERDCLGIDGSTSFVTGSSIPTTCARGGCTGRTNCHAHYAYNCCFGCSQISGGTQGDLRLGHSRNAPLNTHYCHNQMWDYVSGPPKGGMTRKGRDYCGNPMTCSGCGWGCAQPYPGDGGYNGTACGGPCCWGHWGSGGMVKVSYS